MYPARGINAADAVLLDSYYFRHIKTDDTSPPKPSWQ